MVRNASLTEEQDFGTTQVLMSKERKPNTSSKRFTKYVGNLFFNFIAFYVFVSRLSLHIVLSVISSFYMNVIRLFSSCFCRAVQKSASLAAYSTLRK